MTIKSHKLKDNLLLKSVIIICLIIVINSDLGLLAQQSNFRHYSTQQGLSAYDISYIYEDSKGYIYVSNYGAGFGRFDGKNFEFFNTSKGLINNVVNCILEDSEGSILIGTDKGLSIMRDSEIINFTEHEGLKETRIWSMLEGKDKVIWLGTEEGIIKFDGNRFVSFLNESGWPDSRVYALKKNIIGEVIAGTQNGLFKASGNYSEKVNSFDILKNITIFSIYQDNLDTSLWMGTNRGLLHIESGEFQLYTTDDGLPDNYISSVCKDKFNNLWIGTYRGLVKFDGNSFTHYNKSKGINSDMVWNLFIDREENLWIGSDYGLILLLDDNFKNYSEFNNSVLEAWSIFEDKSGDIWIAREKKGIALAKGGDLSKLKKIKGIPEQTFWAIYEDKNGAMWFGADSGLVKYHNSNITHFTSRNGFTDDAVMSLYEDRNGTLWIGTYNNGVFTYEGNQFSQYTTENGLTDNWIYSFHEDSNGNMWIGTERGVSLFNEGKFLNFPDSEDLIKFAILKITEDYYGNLFFGSYEGGVIIYDNSNDSERGIKRIINTEQGLNDNSVVSLVKDNTGDLWIGTNLGLNRLSLKAYQSSGQIELKSFNNMDGLPGNECYQNAALCDSKGKLMFGTAKGIIKFDPDMIQTNYNPPKINITKFQILFQNILSKSWEKKDDNHIYPSQNISLKYNQNYITINYIGICTTNPSKVQYRYKLSGMNWSPVTKETSVTFPNLSPGEYTFSLIAHNNDGIWSKNVESISFTIKPAYWQTKWFVASISLLVVFLIYGGYKYRVDKINLQKSHLEKIIEERIAYEVQLEKSEQELIVAKEKAERSEKLKSDFLAQMSHEIRTPVNTMMSFTSLIEERLQTSLDEDLRDSFLIIKNGGKRLINTIDSILNMSQIQNGTFELFPEKLKVFEILYDLKQEFSPQASEKKLNLEVYKNCEDDEIMADPYTVTQVFANLIDNSIKYTKKGSIDVSVYRDNNNNIAVDVKDTGIGISEDFQNKLFSPFSQEETGYTRRYEGTGLGLALVKNYCLLNKAEISITSKKGEGTVFTVKFLQI